MPQSRAASPAADPAGRADLADPTRSRPRWVCRSNKSIRSRVLPSFRVPAARFFAQRPR